MTHLEKINSLQDELKKLISEEFNNLRSMELIPSDIELDDKYYDLLYELPILYVNGMSGSSYGYYIDKVIRIGNGLLFEGCSSEDKRDRQEFIASDFSINDAIELLNFINKNKCYA